MKSMAPVARSIRAGGLRILNPWAHVPEPKMYSLKPAYIHDRQLTRANRHSGNHYSMTSGTRAEGSAGQYTQLSYPGPRTLLPS